MNIPMTPDLAAVLHRMRQGDRLRLYFGYDREYVDGRWKTTKVVSSAYIGSDEVTPPVATALLKNRLIDLDTTASSRRRRYTPKYFKLSPLGAHIPIPTCMLENTDAPTPV